jgi:TRAP-type C4-dicarboxylate transport system permease small subunit
LSDSPRKTDSALRIIDRTLSGCERVTSGGAIVALMGIVAVVLVQIFARYALSKPPVWTEELSRYLFAYAIVLASAAVITRKRHVRLELFQHKLPLRGALVLGIGCHLLIAIFAFFLLPYAWDFAANGGRQTSPALGIRLAWIFATTVIFFALVAGVSLLMAVRDAITLIVPVADVE